MSCCGNDMNCCQFNVDFGIIYEIEKSIQWFEGPYEFTPSDEEQTIEIAKLTAKQNIKVNPIPSNYGKVSQIGNDLVIE